MSKPTPEDKTLTDEEREAERRFQETLGRLVNTPHKPHAPLNPRGAEKPHTGGTVSNPKK